MSTKFRHLRVPGNLTVFASFTGQSDQVMVSVLDLGSKYWCSVIGFRDLLCVLQV
ncbi:hypothetical protein RchiOBHm_Chr2g0106161 [Rosa chinensis]|uniref:Uncharacterized protein n=1 Tax=Rosa chinensis TaxID=74649 RepID=A0A2P6RNL5_ROSCH|nr:hypothetical protein RchiOBHm_Chr2g0106161 [Rosa chinensis]